ncbi:MAG: MoaD/ThiS family protein [Ktedonobacteraceae bacterium]
MPANTALHEGDELVFIPPMGGGSFQELDVWSL